MHGEVVIRPMSHADADAVAALAGELGYELAAATAAGQIARLGEDSAAFVAFVAGEPAGWVHVFRTDLLQATPFAEIGGLVVTATLRGTGVGRALMAAAETWAMDHGLTEVRVRSRVAREGAHRFHERLGYVTEKTSFTFRRHLTISSPTSPVGGVGSAAEEGAAEAPRRRTFE